MDTAYPGEDNNTFISGSIAYVSTKIMVVVNWAIEPVLLDQPIAHCVIGDELGKHCFLNRHSVKLTALALQA